MLPYIPLRSKIPSKLIQSAHIHLCVWEMERQHTWGTLIISHGTFISLRACSAPRKFIQSWSPYMKVVGTFHSEVLQRKYVLHLSKYSWMKNWLNKKSQFKFTCICMLSWKYTTDLSRRGFLAKAPKENIYFKHSSPLALAAKVW
jgi:hypothetical protein